MAAIVLIFGIFFFFPELPLWETVAMLAVAAGIYTIVGGLKSVMYTDAIQALLLIIGSIFIAFAAFGAAGMRS
jgi:SSS family solute:Na+ symporter